MFSNLRSFKIYLGLPSTDVTKILEVAHYLQQQQDEVQFFGHNHVREYLHQAKLTLKSLMLMPLKSKWKTVQLLAIVNNLLPL